METNKKYYPNIAQSWGILGAIILCSLVFSPISLIKMNRAPDLPQLLCYLLTMGVPFLIFSYVRKSKTGESPYRFEKAPGKIFLLIILGTITIQAGITLPLSNLIPMPEWVVKLFLESMNVQGVFSFITIALAAPILEELIFTPESYRYVERIVRHCSPQSVAVCVGCFAGNVYRLDIFQNTQFVVGHTHSFCKQFDCSCHDACFRRLPIDGY